MDLLSGIAMLCWFSYVVILCHVVIKYKLIPFEKLYHSLKFMVYKQMKLENKLKLHAYKIRLGTFRV